MISSFKNIFYPKNILKKKLPGPLTFKVILDFFAMSSNPFIGCKPSPFSLL